MPEINIYLRQSNGQGHKFLIDLEQKIQNLYSIVSCHFSLIQDEFVLIVGGKIINKQQSDKLSSVIKVKDSIVHIVRVLKQSEEILNVKIYLMGSLIEFKVTKDTQISEIKKFVQEKGKSQNNVLITYLGRPLQNFQTLKSINFSSGDIISALLIPQEESAKRFCFKQTESQTKSQTQNYSKQTDLAPRQYLRKSSMKSSHQSRQKKSDGISESRAKSENESKIDIGNQKQKFEYFFSSNKVSNTPWLLNQNCIETQSINCDQSEQDDPEFWISCSIGIYGENFCYKFDCNQNSTWSGLLEKLSKIFGRKIEKTMFQEKDEYMIKKLQEYETILSVAKELRTQDLLDFFVDLTKI